MARDEPNLDTPDAGELNTAARETAAERGWAMEDGSYPIRPLSMHGRADLDKAVNAVGRGDAPHDKIRRHIMARASALGLTEMIPDNWNEDGSLEGERLQPSLPGIEFRESTVTGIDFPKRQIQVVAVPYDTPATVMHRGQVWQESFTRDAFRGINTKDQGRRRVSVNRDHDMTKPVGRVTQFWPDRREGLVTEVLIGDTALGDDTLALARDDMLSASVGFATKKPSDEVLNRTNMTRTVKRAFLHHLAFVADPAYPDAQVLSVNSSHGFAPDLETPALDELVEFYEEWKRKHNVR